MLHVTPGPSGTSPESTAHTLTLQTTAAAFRGKALALLLDSRVPGQAGGGTGSVFDWSLAAALGVPVLLAGGLTAENVRAAAGMAGVGGVDVSSGVESGMGVKDLRLLEAFVRNARG